MKFFRKILLVLISLNLLAIFLIPLAVDAQTNQTNQTNIPTQCKLSHDLTNINSACSKDAQVAIEQQGTCCLINTVLNVRDWLFTILLIVAAIFIILAAFNFITAAGDPQKVTNARNFVLYALIGVLVALMSLGLISLMKTIVGWV